MKNKKSIPESDVERILNDLEVGISRVKQQAEKNHSIALGMAEVNIEWAITKLKYLLK